MHITSVVSAAALCCVACSADVPSSSRATSPPRAGTGAPVTPGTFSNPSAAGSFAGPQPTVPIAIAGGPAPMQPKRPCSPGVYVGTYTCEIAFAGAFSFPLMGDVKFTLAIDERTVEKCPPGTEFCADLVISKNSGVLFGQAALLWGFETKLEGALDCTTGKFRASGLGGRWGGILFNDPNNPDAWTVDEPPAGTFDGMLDGMHSSNGSQQTIAGNWKLTEGTLMEGLSCTGPFSVTLMP